MITEILLIAVLAYTGVREWMFWRVSNQLLNKLMSRDYHSYKVSEAYKPFERKPKQAQTVSDAEVDSLRELTAL